MNILDQLTDYLVRRRWRTNQGAPSEHAEFGILETGGIAEATPECPEDEVLEAFAAGVCSESTARQVLSHLVDCGHCAPLVRTYLEALEEEPEAVSSRGPIDEPVAIPRPSLWTRVAKFFFPITLRKALTVLALPVMAVLCVAVGLPILNAFSLYSTQKLIFTAFLENGAGDMRLSWSPFPKSGVRGDKPSSAADNPSLGAAAQRVAEKKYSSDPAWIRARGRVKLLLGENADAVKLLDSAVAQGLNDPETQIDQAVAHFELDTRNVPSDSGNETPRNISESLELLTKVLRHPNLSQEQRAVCKFDLAIVYEKMLMWDQAASTWDEYLQLDTSGPWHEQAVIHAKDAQKKIQPPKRQGYREPFFFLQHSADPDVQQSLEDYQDFALRSWLAVAMKDPQSDAYPATHKLAELMQVRHGDSWLNDFLKDLRPDQSQAVELLSAAITDNKHGEYNEAGQKASEAAAMFAEHNNGAGTERATFEALYGNQRLLNAGKCIKQAEALGMRLQDHGYRWLEIQTALIRAVCLNFKGKTDEAMQQLKVGQQKAKDENFRILSLRAAALEASMQSLLDCDETWRLTQAGLNQYWEGPSAPGRLYEFYPPIKRCLEKQKFWHAAEATERRMITILEKEIDRSDAIPVLEATAHKSLEQILRELDDDGAAEDQARIAILLLGNVDRDVARTYEIPYMVELADLQLDRGDTEASLATVNDAMERLRAKADDPLLKLNVLRARGDVHLGRQEWAEAEDDYKEGLRIAEDHFRHLEDGNDRAHWIQETAELCRGFVAVLLLQQRNREALQVWGWFQEHSLLKRSQPIGQASDVQWTEIEKKILAQPVPPATDTRLVYTSARDRLYIWIISSTDIKTVWVPVKRDALQRKISRFIRECSTPQDPDQPLPEPDGDSRELFSLLLQPVIADLRDSSSVVVDLDMGMEGLLVEALKSPEGWYFGQKYPVTYSPGYVRENELRQPLQDPPRSGLLVAALGTAWSERDETIKMFPEVTVLDDPDMTTQALAAQLAPSELFVFIGHGESGKLLLPNNRPLHAKDFAPEYLSNLKLAVLAACSTGVPSNKPLDTTSLVSAFQAGGTPRVIASRWDVDSNTTTELMISFYAHLKNDKTDKSVSRALLEARKKIFRNPDHRHPYYWAGFVLNGRA